MALTVYIGIDPGSKGGIAALYGDRVKFRSIPKTEEEIYDLLSDYVGVLSDSNISLDSIPVTASIELIRPGFKGTSKGSMAKLYGSYMSLRMALTAADIQFKTVDARTWHRALGISPRRGRGDEAEDTTQWKQRLKREAQKRFPKLFITLDTADALLLAYYCRLTHEG